MNGEKDRLGLESLDFADTGDVGAGEDFSDALSGVGPFSGPLVE